MPGTVRGGDRFVRSLHEAGAALDDLGDTTQTIAGWLGPRVVKASPRVTGTLAASITVTGWAQGLTVEAGADYAAAVHKRNPFIARTIAQSETDVVEDITEGVSEVLATVKGS